MSNSWNFRHAHTSVHKQNWNDWFGAKKIIILKHPSAEQQRAKGIINRGHWNLFLKYDTFGLAFGSIFSHHFQLLIASKHTSAEISYFHCFAFPCTLPTFPCENVLSISWEMNEYTLCTVRLTLNAHIRTERSSVSIVRNVRVCV